MPINALRGGFRVELTQLLRSRLFVALVVIQATTFLFLVSLFALTGSMAPTALVSQDQGSYARAFINQLAAAHHSFDLRPMDEATAQAALRHGDLVAMITIPRDFSNALANGQTVSIQVSIDNVNTDMTEDIQRALPSAIVSFGQKLHLSNIHVHVAEEDLVDQDTSFIPYLVVSGLVLDAFVIACTLGATAVAREFESGTVRLLTIAPVHPLLSILGRVLATDLVAACAMTLPVAVTLLGYHVVPLHPLLMIGVLLLCVVLFSCIGVALGTLLKRTLPVASLVFGLCLPLYIFSGALEPERFDGDLIWMLSHISPVYYPVGLLEYAFHGLQVTPEPLSTDLIVFLVYALAMLLLAGLLLGRRTFQQKREPRVMQQPSIRWYRIALTRYWSVLVLLVLVLTSAFWLSSQPGVHADRQQLQQTIEHNGADDQQNALVLQSYIDAITDMLTNNNLLFAKQSDPAAIVATIRTLQTLHQLDPARKAQVIYFLYEAKLIGSDGQVISLKGADLHAIQLTSIDLNDINLSGADLSGADLHNIDLHTALLVNTDLSGANLSGANLSYTDMSQANVSDANLSKANLTQAAGISPQELARASSLAGATLPNGTIQPVPDNDQDTA